MNLTEGALSTVVMGTGYSYLQNGGPNYGLHTYFDASKVVPTANENRPTNSSMIVLIKVKTVVERIPVDNDPYATEIKAGIFKITNEITGSRNDVVVTEKAVANNTLSFEPYNKVEVDVFSETNKESTVNVKDIFKDGSCKNFYQFNNNCDEYNNIPRTTANNNISYVEGKFGAASYYNTPGETYPIVQDTNTMGYINLG